MAKVVGGLLSARATGTIADTLTFQQRGRRGVCYKFTVPKDAGTVAQVVVRDEVKDLQRRWFQTDEELRVWFEVFASECGQSGWSLFTQELFQESGAGVPD